MPLQSPLLFLDFDGVLHPSTSATFIYLPLLQEFLRKYPEIRVVLTTSWRMDNPLAELLELFDEDIRHRVVGMTPSLPALTRYQRHTEINHWILLHDEKNFTPWVALDDDAELFPPFCKELVLCNTGKGLRPAQLEEVRVKLRLPPA